MDRLVRSLHAGEGDEGMRAFLDGSSGSFARMHPKAISRELYSDYVTPLDDGICAARTAIHAIHALRMDPDGKHEERCLRRFRDPEPIPFDTQHEEWLFGGRWTDAVPAAIDGRMGVSR